MSVSGLLIAMIVYAFGASSSCIQERKSPGVTIQLRHRPAAWKASSLMADTVIAIPLYVKRSKVNASVEGGIICVTVSALSAAETANLSLRSASRERYPGTNPWHPRYCDILTLSPEPISSAVIELAHGVAKTVKAQIAQDADVISLLKTIEHIHEFKLDPLLQLIKHGSNIPYYPFPKPVMKSKNRDSYLAIQTLAAQFASDLQHPPLTDEIAQRLMANPPAHRAQTVGGPVRAAGAPALARAHTGTAGPIPSGRARPLRNGARGGGECELIHQLLGGCHNVLRLEVPTTEFTTTKML
ncbi:hypothetical protein C8F04DRAFT_1184062 [Mycena alexandri]|uniref:Uncharacterized protein n=1 Tax=Mycena alexandri TaxID=1745969 RepID=A0AAD6X2K0_9AGAR|nr:hypothetical protein C8F04DRAFT_1184062 [Mycena alexandri]